MYQVNLYCWKCSSTTDVCLATIPNRMYGGIDKQLFCWIQYIKLVNGTCIVNNRNLIVVNSVFVGMSAEVILVCFVVCIVFCFLHKIVQNRQSASLFKRSQYNIIIIGKNISFFVFCIIFITTTFVNIKPITLYISLYFLCFFLFAYKCG